MEYSSNKQRKSTNDRKWSSLWYQVMIWYRQIIINNQQISCNNKTTIGKQLSNIEKYSRNNCQESSDNRW